MLLYADTSTKPPSRSTISAQGAPVWGDHSLDAGRPRDPCLKVRMKVLRHLNALIKKNTTTVNTDLTNYIYKYENQGCLIGGYL
jgi:hypothetical protein